MKQKIMLFTMKLILLYVKFFPLPFHYIIISILIPLAILANPKRFILGYIQIKNRLKISNIKSIYILLKSYINLSCLLLEFLNIPNLNKKNLENDFEVSGLKHFDDALKKEKGVLLLTAHIGNWEVLGQYLVILNYPLSSIAKTQKYEAIDRFINKIRCSHNMEIVTKGFGLKALINALKNKRIIGILQDIDAKNNGIMINFLNKPASTPTTIANLHKKYKTPIVPAFLVRKRYHKYRIIVLPPIEMYDKEKKEILKKCNDIISEIIYKYPAQWLWLHNRWRTKMH